MPEAKHSNRLPRNFHKTFKPERQYIHAMLRYAASGKYGDHQAISAATGIPTGSSSGKVPAILDYCRGMGLIILSGSGRLSSQKIDLTPFGRIVLLEDPFLKTGISQWLAHLNLCSPLSGADVWYHTFFVGAVGLGLCFSRNSLEEYLGMTYGVDKSGLIGPLVGSYQEDAAFSKCGALSESKGIIHRKPAPVLEEMGFAYGAWMIQLMTDHFPMQNQVSTEELDAAAGWRLIPAWDDFLQQRVLQLIERKGLLEIDRHLEPWLLRPIAPLEKAWMTIYNDLV